MYPEVENLPALLTLHVRSANLSGQLCILRDAGVKEIYISIDGPRDQKEKKMQERIYGVIENYKKDFCKFEVRHLGTNQGIALGITSAIDWFFTFNKYGMIFEDDIKFESQTLAFFKEALFFIEDKPRVLLVSGFQPFDLNQSSSKILFTNYPQIWGWATSASKWRQMRAFIFQLPRAEKQIRRQVRNFWQVGWKRAQVGYLDTWDLPIATGMLFSNKLCLLPPVNLTSNIGADEFSTNTHSDAFPLGLKIQHIDSDIEFADLPLDSEVKFLNTMFENEIYRISFRNNFSLIFSFLDKYRFSRKRTPHLRERL